jgi:flagellin-like hook-associated protein FlgL
MTEQPKVVPRSVALIIGAICIVLAVGMIVALIAYLPASSQIDSLNAQIAQKAQSITTLNAQITALNAQINSQSGQNSTSSDTALQIEINGLEAQINSLNNMLYLNGTGLLVSDQGFTMEANSNVTLWDPSYNPLIYAGYITVQATSSSSTTFVELAYNSYGVAYDNVVTLGISGQAAFPVLPGGVTILLGNTESNDTVTGTITATYVY